MSSRDIRKIVSIVRENSLHAYLATCDGDQPMVRPVSPIVENDLTIWVTTFESSRKVQQVLDNPKVSLAFVEQPSGDRAATVIGECAVVSDPEKKKRVWALATFDLARHFPRGPESSELCLLKITAKRIEWWEDWAEGRRVYEPEVEE